MKKKKINDSERLAFLERYLYGFDLDGKRLDAGNQNGMSLRARLQENITGYSGRFNTYTIEEVLKKIQELDNNLNKVKDVQTYILSLLIGACVGVAIAWAISFFL